MSFLSGRFVVHREVYENRLIGTSVDAQRARRVTLGEYSGTRYSSTVHRIETREENAMTKVLYQVHYILQVLQPVAPVAQR